MADDDVYDQGGEAGEQINKGPNGSGPYRHDNNVLAQSGEVEETEATNVTGDVMALMQVQDNRGSLSTSSAPASPKDMSGGN